MGSVLLYDAILMAVVFMALFVAIARQTPWWNAVLRQPALVIVAIVCLGGVSIIAYGFGRGHPASWWFHALHESRNLKQIGVAVPDPNDPENILVILQDGDGGPILYSLNKKFVTRIVGQVKYE